MENTKEAACKDPEYAYSYARDINQIRNDTRSRM